MDQGLSASPEFESFIPSDPSPVKAAVRGDAPDAANAQEPRRAPVRVSCGCGPPAVLPASPHWAGILIGQIDGDQIIHTFDMSETFPTDERGLMTRYLSTGAYFDIGTGWDGHEVPYEHVVAVTIWVHNVFDYINLFENGVDLRKLYEKDKLYEEN